MENVIAYFTHILKKWKALNFFTHESIALKNIDFPKQVSSFTSLRRGSWLRIATWTNFNAKPFQLTNKENQVSLYQFLKIRYFDAWKCRIDCDERTH